jgi:hypothetical protein
MLKARLLFVNQLLGSVIAEEIFTMPEVNMLLRTKPRPPFEPSHQAISYLDKVEECERLAAQAQDPGVKAALVSIARQWLELARQVAKLERDR